MMRSEAAFCATFRAIVLVLGFGLAGCAPEFEPQAKLDTLRVLAVQKDRPYAQPGDEVRLDMLWTDGSEEAGRAVEIAWISGCHNPLGDLYAGCFADASTEPEIGFGDQFSLTVPADIISSRPPPQDPRQPPYGLSYVFFAACAGTLDVGGGSGGGLPLRCLDDQGNALGSDDFVAGYTAIYTYDEFQNSNPVIRGLSLDGKPLLDVCIDPGSAAAIESGDLGAVLGRAAEGAGPASASEPPVVCDSGPLVEPMEEPDCSDPAAACITAPIPGFLTTAHELRPEVFRSSVEDDDIARVAYGHDYEEQMWINYYVSRGSLRSDVRLLNDATTGLNEEFPTLFYPANSPGPATLWAVVHDNRGGVAWARGSVWVE